MLALAASKVEQMGQRREVGDEASAAQNMGLSGVVTRSEATVKAFSGRGQALGSRHDDDVRLNHYPTVSCMAAK